jgi:ATP-dependent DNA ligase
VKFAKRQELVIGGFRPSDDSFDALPVGYYEGKRLMFVGKVRAGFTPALRREVFSRLKPLLISKCPFENLLSTKTPHWGEGITTDDMASLRCVGVRAMSIIAGARGRRNG